ncbi:MAG: biopolymer transport protein ExbB [Verrucomicrobiota bacterium]|jgi:biopolymer transport protein ExbB
MNASPETGSTVLQLFLQGGVFMLLLAICSVVGGAVILLRILALRRDFVVPPRVKEEVHRFQPDSESAVARLSSLLLADRSPLGRILRVALKHLEVSRSENQDAVQVVARGEVVRLEQGLFILEILVGITPLLGLLGAVSGLVKVFGAFGSAAGQSDPHIIASGIAEALSTTVVGLAIAIPCLIAYTCFARKVETLATDMEGIVSLLLTKCYQRRGAAHHASAESP